MTAAKDRPITGTFAGMVNEAAFNASVSVGSLTEMLGSMEVLPLRVAVQTADVQFKTEGTITLPLKSKQFPNCPAKKSRGSNRWLNLCCP